MTQSQQEETLKKVAELLPKLEPYGTIKLSLNQNGSLVTVLLENKEKHEVRG